MINGELEQNPSDVSIRIRGIPMSCWSFTLSEKPIHMRDCVELVFRDLANEDLKRALCLHIEAHLAVSYAEQNEGHCHFSGTWLWY